MASSEVFRLRERLVDKVEGILGEEEFWCATLLPQPDRFYSDRPAEINLLRNTQGLELRRAVSQTSRGVGEIRAILLYGINRPEALFRAFLADANGDNYQSTLSRVKLMANDSSVGRGKRGKERFNAYPALIRSFILDLDEIQGIESDEENI